MTWQCPQCQNELGDYNAYCEYCFVEDKSNKVYNPDKYYIREVCIYHITHRASGASEMTPQEELFKELFTGAVKIVQGMDALTRRAYREEMQKIAYEARVHVAAVDKIDDDEKKAKRTKDNGFTKSLNTDEATTDAINTIKERQKRLTKREKLQEQLEKSLLTAGMSLEEARKFAQKSLGAGTILAVTNPEKAVAVQNAVENAKSEMKESKIDSTTSSKMFNPFEKRE